MTFEDRVHALERWRFTPRQCRFLALVALHSGYCLRRQYTAFSEVAYGKNVADFLDSLVDRGLAESFTARADRGVIYHLSARPIYAAIGQRENRNRRVSSAALIARKLMVLDYVLGHPEVDWLGTEEDKVELFVQRFGVPAGDLPHIVFAAARPGTPGTTRHFVHKLPVAVSGDPPIVYFVYLAADASEPSFARFLHQHARLFAWLPRWTVLAVGVNPRAVAACDAAFARFGQGSILSSTLDRADLRWFFQARRDVDRGDLTRLSVADISRFRKLREEFSGPSCERMYADWLGRGDDALMAERDEIASSDRRSGGRLVTDVLKFDYSQFGSLPGVA